MATLVLQTAGAALGGAVGGSFGATLGRAAGALAGHAIDQQLFGRDQIVKGPRLEQAQILASSDGAGLPKVYGRARIGGQIIWATRFEEVASTSRQGAGKGTGAGVTVKEFTYNANFAVAICEGPIAGIGRVWADGIELDRTRHEIRFYLGDETQQVDPLIEARQGATPAFRGTACAVFEGFALEDFGNRIPQLSFEVIRPVSSLETRIRSVAIIPGATEFGYAPEPVKSKGKVGETRYANRHTLTAASDWQASLDELQALCPNLETVALVVAWFGNDLRAAGCTLRPRVEFKSGGGEDWQVGGLERKDTLEVSRVDDKPAFGGTPSDSAVVAAIQDLKARGLKVVLYPFVMMDIPADNALPDPHGEAKQAAYPWRGDITCMPGPQQPGTADRTSAARDQVQAFAGAATPGDFVIDGETVSYAGGEDWGYRRMILHHAHLGVAAGGVDGFLVGSEMRGLTTLRDETGAFPFVEILRDLAADVRGVIGGATRITYGADWSEYFGHHPQDGSDDVYFHLDPLWADPAIDAVGIDNYMPLADWRMSGDPGDPGIRTQFDPGYMLAGIAGGEGYDWFYASGADRRAGVRTPIADGFGEAWIWRFKDIHSWWANAHHERVGGARSPVPTAWVPQGKPIWFTEIGCAAVAMGANRPNVFADSKSGQSGLPWFSTGARADLVQHRFLSAHFDWWDSDIPDLPADRNPVSPVYDGPMVDPADICPWAWDARPFPTFPADKDAWSDGVNWHTGHWLNGRLGGCPVDALCDAIAGDFGIALNEIRADGFVDGYVVPGPSPARAAMEPLLTLFNIAYVEEGGMRRLQGKAYGVRAAVSDQDLAGAGGEPLLELHRDHESELPRQADLSHAGIFSGYEPERSYSRRLETASRRTVSMNLPVVMPASTAIGAMEARLRDVWVGRESLGLRLSNRHLALSAGDEVVFPDGKPQGVWRIDSIEDGEFRELALHAIAHFDETGTPAVAPDYAASAGEQFGAPALTVMNLPLAPHADAPHVHVALSATPWARQYGVFASPGDSGFALRDIVSRQAVTGVLAADLSPGPEGRWDNAAVLHLAPVSGELAGMPELLVLNGANAAAVQAGSGEWEVLQFADAQLQGDGSWILSRLLRGQLGTEAAMQSGAAAGSAFVLLDEAVTRVDLTTLESGLALNWRAGPATDPPTGSTYAATTHAHAALSSRPLSPVHLAALRDGAGDVELSWIRRSRIDADDWEAPETPLGEASEAYRVDILRPDDSVARTMETGSDRAIYTTALQLADFGLLPSAVSFTVAQLATNGTAGTPRRATVTL
ncbi:MAG: glycoside hydrolase/phage tail family protein [Pseudomonadota bacterium]|nr:glycoside hydrolase/phage tail family protein [Pseudomonadota bacterium]